MVRASGRPLLKGEATLEAEQGSVLTFLCQGTRKPFSTAGLSIINAPISIRAYAGPFCFWLVASFPPLRVLDEEVHHKRRPDRSRVMTAHSRYCTVLLVVELPF